MEAAQPPPQAPPPPPPPGPVPPAPRRVDVGQTISEVFVLYREHAGVLLGLAAAVFVFTGLISALLYSTGSIFLIFLSLAVDIVAITLYTGMVVKLADDVRGGRPASSINDLIGSAAPAIVPLIVNGFLKGIAVAIGLILLIAPGLYLLTIWAVTAPAIVLERLNGIAAFGRSQALVKGEGWNVFGVIVIAFLIQFAIGIFFGAIGFAIGDIGGYILRILAAIFTAPISALVAALLFFRLRGDAAVAPAAPAAPAGPAQTVVGQPPAPPPPGGPADTVVGQPPPPPTETQPAQPPPGPAETQISQPPPPPPPRED